MEIKIIEEKDNLLRFIISGVTPAFVNSLRRTILSEVPTMAIDEVIIVENTTSFYDEYIAHRLGLIPLKTDLKRYKYITQETSEEERVMNTARRTLDYKCQRGEDIIYSGDLKPIDPEIKPVNPKIPIVKVIKNQKLVLEAIARLGKGKEHAKWQPVSTVSYGYLPIIEINEETCNGCGECIKNCPFHVFKQNGEVKVETPSDCNMCKLCIETCPEKSIQITYDKKSFVFNIESTGALPPKEIIEEAIKILKNKLATFKEQLEK